MFAAGYLDCSGRGGAAPPGTRQGLSMPRRGVGNSVGIPRNCNLFGS